MNVQEATEIKLKRFRLCVGTAGGKFEEQRYVTTYVKRNYVTSEIITYADRKMFPGNNPMNNRLKNF
jgi:hypothetical protein